MNTQEIRIMCWACAGIGKAIVGHDLDNKPIENDCPQCNGKKFLSWGRLSDAIPTYKILEATDSDEYMALDANKKHWYDLFISAGTLDMSDGTKANDLFLAWLFPPGKITHAAILAIL